MTDVLKLKLENSSVTEQISGNGIDWPAQYMQIGRRDRLQPSIKTKTIDRQTNIESSRYDITVDPEKIKQGKTESNERSRMTGEECIEIRNNRIRPEVDKLKGRIMGSVWL